MMVNIEDSVVEVDPQLFFQRLFVSIQPDKDALHKAKLIV